MQLPDINYRRGDPTTAKFLQVYTCRYFNTLRVGMLEIRQDRVEGTMHALYFRRNRTNWVSPTVNYRNPVPRFTAGEIIDHHRGINYMPPTTILRQSQTMGRYQEGDPIPLRVQPQEVAHAAAVMLDAYVTWLNIHVAADNERYQTQQESRYPGQPLRQNLLCPTYTPTVFTDPPYGYIELIAVYATSQHDAVLVLTVSDGDDGGPSTLTGYFTGGGVDYTKTAYPGRLRAMTQEFDTDIQFIVQDGDFVNTPDTD